MNDVFQFNIYDIYGQISERVRERERGGGGEGGRGTQGIDQNAG